MSVTVLCCNLYGIVGILCAPQSSCCYVIEQMDCSVSLLHKSFLAHTTQWWADNAQKKEEKKNTECFANPDYYNKSNNVESKTLAIIICVTDLALLIAFYGLCCSPWC